MTPPATKANHATSKSLPALFALWLLLVVALLCISYSPAVLAADAANRQQAIDMALRSNGGNGKVLGVQTIKGENGRTVFAVKVLANGRVRVFRFNQAN